MRTILQSTHAKAQRREGIWISKLQLLFASLRLCVSVCFLSFAVAASAQMTNGLSDAEIQGCNLAKQLVDTKPSENLTNNGILEIRAENGNKTNLALTSKITLLKNGWQARYITTNNEFLVKFGLLISHSALGTNEYRVVVDESPLESFQFGCAPNQTAMPFANSDFWICDLGLEFFHWPEQKIIKKEFARGRGCMVLESTNPNPSPNGYSRVDCWIDEETLGIVEAKAYDANGKLLKEFEPKSFKKDATGQWQLQDMEIRNVQTGSRTEIKFDLPKS